MAIAGPPAVGKSTTAEAVVTALSHAGHAAVLVPMDGFHLDNSILDARGLLPRKGAPETFDIAGLTHLVARLRAEDEVMFPVFDRAVDCAIAGRGRVGPEHRVIVSRGITCFSTRLTGATWRATGIIPSSSARPWKN